MAASAPNIASKALRAPLNMTEGAQNGLYMFIPTAAELSQAAAPRLVCLPANSTTIIPNSTVLCLPH